MGVCYHGGAPAGFATYFAGAEVAPGTEVPGFTSWRLPARDYVICGFEAENPQKLAESAVPKAMKYTRFWLREHGLIADGFFPELYYKAKSAPETAYMELWVPFRQREPNE